MFLKYSTRMYINISIIYTRVGTDLISKELNGIAKQGSIGLRLEGFGWTHRNQAFMPAYDITCAEAVNRWSDFLDVSVFADRETVVDNQLIFRKLPRATRTNQKLLRANFLQAVIAVTDIW